MIRIDPTRVRLSLTARRIAGRPWSPKLRHAPAPPDSAQNSTSDTRATVAVGPDEVWTIEIDQDCEPPPIGAGFCLTPLAVDTLTATTSADETNRTPGQTERSQVFATAQQDQHLAATISSGRRAIAVPMLVSGRQWTVAITWRRRSHTMDDLDARPAAIAKDTSGTRAPRLAASTPNTSHGANDDSNDYRTNSESGESRHSQDCSPRETSTRSESALETQATRTAHSKVNDTSTIWRLSGPIGGLATNLMDGLIMSPISTPTREARHADHARDASLSASHLDGSPLFIAADDAGLVAALRWLEHAHPSQRRRSVAAFSLRRLPPLPIVPASVVMPALRCSAEFRQSLATLRLLDDWGVAARIATLAGWPGCFDGDLVDALVLPDQSSAQTHPPPSRLTAGQLHDHHERSRNTHLAPPDGYRAVHLDHEDASEGLTLYLIGRSTRRRLSSTHDRLFRTDHRTAVENPAEPSKELPRAHSEFQAPSKRRAPSETGAAPAIVSLKRPGGGSGARRESWSDYDSGSHPPVHSNDDSRNNLEPTIPTTITGRIHRSGLILCPRKKRTP